MTIRIVIIQKRSEKCCKHSPVSPQGKENVIESLTAKLDQLQLLVEEQGNEIKISERKRADLTALVESNKKKHEDELRNVLETNKCQLESQRLDFKE